MEKISFKSFYGLFLSLMTAITYSLMSVIVRGAYLLNGSEQNSIRLVVQFIIISIIGRIYKVDFFTSQVKEQRSLLTIRAILGAMGMLTSYFTLTLINPSDGIAIFNVNILITAIMSRIFLKEKLTLIHIIAILIAISGVFLITQPSFLFPQPSYMNTTNLTSYSTIKSTTGFVFAFSYVFIFASVAILIRTLSEKKLHYTVNIFYSSLLGIPITIILSVILIWTGTSELISHYNNRFDQLKYHLFLSFIGSLVGTVYMILFNLSLQYEEPSKVTIVRTTEIFFVFAFQYVFLNKPAELLKLVGGLLIFMSGFCILCFKIVDSNKKRQVTRAQETGEQIKHRPTPAICRIFLFEF